MEWVWKIKQGCFCYMVYWYLKKKCQKIMHIVLTVRISCQNFCPLGRIDAYQGVLCGTLFYILWQRMRRESANLTSALLPWSSPFFLLFFYFCFVFVLWDRECKSHISSPSLARVHLSHPFSVFLRILLFSSVTRRLEKRPGIKDFWELAFTLSSPCAIARLSKV